jgi:hypothetical protein
MTVHCKQCGQQWEPNLKIVGLPLDRAVMAMQGIVAAGCPKCRATGDNVLVGPKPRPKKAMSQAQGI